MTYHEEIEHTFDESGRLMADRERQYAPLGWCGKCMISAHNSDKRPIAVAMVDGTGLCVDCLRHERNAQNFGSYGRSASAGSAQRDPGEHQHDNQPD